MLDKQKKMEILEKELTEKGNKMEELINAKVNERLKIIQKSGIMNRDVNTNTGNTALELTKNNSSTINTTSTSTLLPLPRKKSIPTNVNHKNNAMSSMQPKGQAPVRKASRSGSTPMIPTSAAEENASAAEESAFAAISNTFMTNQDIANDGTYNVATMQRNIIKNIMSFIDPKISEAILIIADRMMAAKSSGSGSGDGDGPRKDSMMSLNDDISLNSSQHGHKDDSHPTTDHHQNNRNNNHSSGNANEQHSLASSSAYHNDPNEDRMVFDANQYVDNYTEQMGIGEEGSGVSSTRHMPTSARLRQQAYTDSSGKYLWPPAPTYLGGKIPTTILIFPLHTIDQSTNTDTTHDSDASITQAASANISNILPPISNNNSIVAKSSYASHRVNNTLPYQETIDPHKEFNDFRHMLSTSDNQLLRLYEVFFPNLSVIARHRLIGSAAHEKMENLSHTIEDINKRSQNATQNSLHEFEYILQLLHDEVSKLENTVHLALQSLETFQLTMSDLITIMDANAIIEENFFVSLGELSG